MSIKEIQKITGYSRSTISRVLSGRAKAFRIADRTAQTIFEAAEKINYRPNLIAQSLRLKRTMTIGLIVPDIQNPFFGELGSRLEKLLRQQGYSTILCNTNEIPESEEFYLNILFDRRVDGIIITPCQAEEWPSLRQIREEIPVVLLDRIFMDTDLPWVTSDNVTAAERLTEQLIGNGCKKIAYLGGKLRTYINTVRFKGFKNVMEKNSLDIDYNLVHFSGYSMSAGEDMMSSMMESGHSFDGIFCVNNLVFLGAAKLLQSNVDEKNGSLSIGAFDIGSYCGFFHFRLVSADQDLRKLADSAADLLLDRINGRDAKDNHLTLSCSLEKYY